MRGSIRDIALLKKIYYIVLISYKHTGVISNDSDKSESISLHFPLYSNFTNGVTDLCDPPNFAWNVAPFLSWTHISPGQNFSWPDFWK